MSGLNLIIIVLILQEEVFVWFKSSQLALKNRFFECQTPNKHASEEFLREKCIQLRNYY